jgi:predicted SprT family Zn-dependent metalloprotease
MKTINLVLLLFITSCSSIEWKKIIKDSQGNLIKSTIEEPIESVKEVELKEVSEDKNTLDVKSFKGFTNQEIAKFWATSKAMDQAVNSSCYSNYILNASRFEANKDDSREETIANLRGKKPALNFVMYYKNNSTVGYTYPNSDTIWMNRKFHQNYSLAYAASNTHHEISHKLGYGHDFKKTERRQYQTPYVVGRAVSKCIVDPNYEAPVESSSEYKTYCKRVWYKLYLGKTCYTVVSK